MVAIHLRLSQQKNENIKIECDILEREDATELEKLIAKGWEEGLKSLITSAGEALGQKVKIHSI